MVIVSKGKSVRVSAEPEDDDNPTLDLVNEMREEIHGTGRDQTKTRRDTQ